MIYLNPLEDGLLEAVDLECVRGDRPLFGAFLRLKPRLMHITGVNGGSKTTCYARSVD
jgi:hypothetical protein